MLGFFYMNKMVIYDNDLGEIRLVKNNRARRITVRKKDGYLCLTYPPSVKMSYIKKTIEEMKPQLKSLVEKKSERLLFSPQTNLETLSFRLRIATNPSTDNYYIKLKDGVLSVSCPADTDYMKPSVQDVIRGLIENALRYEANRIFPSK
ncbi:MAG: hypothetical protein LBN74_10325, partial [Prevotella sp.]|nr:hypothetical protein [Prevotella sp.]